MQMELEEIHNFLQVDDRLATGGMPTEDQLALLQEAGYEVVINLAMPMQPSALINEAELVADLGMEYISIPVVFNMPTAEALTRFMDAMDTRATQKCFVHCMANHRVSVFLYLYRVLRLGVSPAEAEVHLHQVWKPNAVWEEFVRSQLAQSTQ